jgi:hypothetical protein
MRRAGSGHAVVPGLTSVVMRHRALPAFASVLTVAIAVSGCAPVTAGTASNRHAASASPSATATARASAPVYGPPGPDPACAAALRAEQALQARQGRDQNNESALDQDFTNFANALSAAARQETHPATAKAMTTLADDFNALVESQSGAGELPSMNTVENDGAVFDKACSLFLIFNDTCGLPARSPGREAGPESGFWGQVQVVPLIANDVGLAWLLVHVPWKPSVVLPPGAMVPL